jgi:fluoride exporter
MGRKYSPTDLFWVAFGGMAGAVMRHGTNYTVTSIFGKNYIYTATAIENILGSFLMGFFYILLIRVFDRNHRLNLFLLVGLIGSYTTYSAYGTQAVLLIQESVPLFMVYLFGQLIFGLLALIAGMKLANKI